MFSFINISFSQITRQMPSIQSNPQTKNLSFRCVVFLVKLNKRIVLSLYKLNVRSLPSIRISNIKSFNNRKQCPTTERPANCASTRKASLEFLNLLGILYTSIEHNIPLVNTVRLCAFRHFLSTQQRSKSMCIPQEASCVRLSNNSTTIRTSPLP